MFDDEVCYRLLNSRDARFDGVFYVGVSTTGIYCRPSCPAMTPKRANVGFYPSAAAAQQAGFRACKRCRPDASPGSPEWNVRADLVGRAMRLIADGVVDRAGVTGLAAQLGYSERQVHRQLTAEVGAGPIALARAQRAQTARVLLETTDVPVSGVAFAAGFASIRQFNDTVRAVFATTPSELRRRRSANTRDGGGGGARGSEPGSSPGLVRLRLPYREPFAAQQLFGFLGSRAVSGVETYDGTTYARSLGLPHGSAIVELTPADRHVRCVLRMADVRDLAAAVQRCRRLLDLDADPVATDAMLGGDPVLATLTRATPGIRLPGHVDGNELAVRAVLGQQVSVVAARTVAGRLVAKYGKPLTAPYRGVTHLFPAADTLAGADEADLPMPGSRRRALLGLVSALAAGKIGLDAGADRDEAEHALLALPGIGPWTASYVRMRALSDPDVFLPSDLGVRHALRACGVSSDPRSAAALAEAWRPWRSYALMHLWESL